MKLFSGSSHPALAQGIAKCLGINIAPLELTQFPDGEIMVRLTESVRGEDVFIVQSIALDPNKYLVELLIIIDALKRASARTITPVLSYFGYCRQDRKDKPREPISARLVADLLAKAGATHILTMDLHAGQIEGFFDIPVDHIHGMPALAQAFRELTSNHVDYSAGRPAREAIPGQCIVVAPDIGSVKQARAYARYLQAEFAVVDKRRLSATQVESATVIGEVKGKDVLLADDMCSTGGTLVSAAKACREKGARRIYAAATHGILVGDSVEIIENSPIDVLLISNTIPSSERLDKATKVHVVPVESFFAQGIRCIVSKESIYT